MIMPDIAGMPNTSSKAARALPPIADYVDERISNIDRQIDWLTHLSPLHNEQLWDRFVKSDFQEEPKLEYPPLSVTPEEVRAELAKLPIAEIESPLLKALLAEKQTECELFTYLIETRDTSGALATSLQLFGGMEAHLIQIARTILATVPIEPGTEDLVGLRTVTDAAQEMLRTYQEEHPNFSSRLIIEDDLNSNIMVSHGNLHIDKSILIPRSRVAPLLAHEIGTHVVTYHNGAQQSLRLLREGLPSYDETQEGLGAFSEYLAGYLPPTRLRILAARVMSTSLVAEGATIVDLFEVLISDYRLTHHDAFDVAVRARRGGGLTKDSVYLRGLHELLEHLKGGGNLTNLFLGKFALAQRHLVEELMAAGWAIPAQILPHYFLGNAAKERLNQALNGSLEDLYQLEPEP